MQRNCQFSLKVALENRDKFIVPAAGVALLFVCFCSRVRDACQFAISSEAYEIVQRSHTFFFRFWLTIFFYSAIIYKAHRKSAQKKRTDKAQYSSIDKTMLLRASTECFVCGDSSSRIYLISLGCNKTKRRLGHFMQQDPHCINFEHTQFLRFGLRATADSNSASPRLQRTGVGISHYHQKRKFQSWCRIFALTKTCTCMILMLCCWRICRCIYRASFLTGATNYPVLQSRLLTQFLPLRYVTDPQLYHLRLFFHIQQDTVRQLLQNIARGRKRTCRCPRQQFPHTARIRPRQLYRSPASRILQLALTSRR